MTDIATLGIKIDSSETSRADQALDKLAETGAKTEASTKKVSSATKAFDSVLNELLGAIKANTAATESNSTATANYGKNANVATSASSAFTKEMADLQIKLAAAENALDATSRASVHLASETDQLKSAVASSEAVIASLKSEIDKLKAALENTNKPVDALADRVNRLKASTDPFGAAQDRVNAEMAEAQTLYEMGARSAEEYARDMAVLTARTDDFAQKQNVFNERLVGAQKNLKLTATEGLNMSRQMADVGVTAAMGMNPFMIAIQQGPQILDTLQQAAQRTGTSVGRVLIDNLAPLVPALAATAIAVGTVVGAFAIFNNEVSKDVGDVGDVGKSMGLTQKELDKLKDKGVSTTVTLGDSFKAFFQVTGDRLKEAFKGPLDYINKKLDDVYNFVVEKGSWAIKETMGLWFGGYDAIVATWSILPSAMGDLFVQVINKSATAINDMVDQGLDGLNKLLSNVPDWLAPGGTGITKKRGGWVASTDNPYAGAAKKAGDEGAKAFGEGRSRGRKATSDFYDDVVTKAGSNKKDEINEALGDRKKDKEKKSDAEKEYERAIKAAEAYVKSLKEETSEIGKNRIETKLMSAERAAAAAPTEKLKAEILDSAKAWKDATTADATKKLKLELSDENETLKFQSDLLKMNAKERELATAKREIALKVQALEREGIYLSVDAINEETIALMKQAEIRGQKQLDSDNIKAFTESVHEMNDALRESVAGFGELFGTAGQGFENLINVISDYADKRADLEATIADKNDESAEGDRKRQQATDELARATVANYGNMLGASKTFFDKGTTGYKVLEAAEKAYRLYQMVSTVLHIANTAKSIAADTAHTASSVTKSGIRAAADGVAAIAKAIASLPFPLNLIAGAATAAALVSFGVKIFGGGGAGAGASTATSSTSEDTGPGDSTSMRSPYSTLPGAGGLYDPNNAGQNGTPTPASSNDNGYAANNATVGSYKGSSFTYSPQINAQGAEAGVEDRVRQMLDADREQVIQLAREAAAEDQAYANSRQRN